MKRLMALWALFIATSCGGGGSSGSPEPTIDLEYTDIPNKVVMVEFTGPTAEVNFTGLNNAEIYMIRMNLSASHATNFEVGSLQSISVEGLSPDPFPYAEPQTTSTVNFPYAHIPPLEFEEPQDIPIFQNIMPLSEPNVSDTRLFFISPTLTPGNWALRTATLCAKGTHAYVWVENTHIGTETGQINCSASNNEAQKMSNWFDKIHPVETALLGNEYEGKGPQTGIDGDPRVHIYIYDIGNAAGYFWGKDLYSKSAYYGSNAAEMIYMDLGYIKDYTDSFAPLTLIHEYQHLINFTRKGNTTAWYTELLSTMVSDVIGTHPDVNIPYARYNNPWHYLSASPSYNAASYMEWEYGDSLDYRNVYILGTYLARNYSGAAFIRAVLDNGYKDHASIGAALHEIRPAEFTSNYMENLLKAFARMGEALVFTETGYPLSINNVNREISSSVKGYTYTFYPLDIANRPNSLPVKTEPFATSDFISTQNIFSNYYIYRYGLLLGKYNKKVSGDVKLVLSRPSKANVKVFIMVK